MSPRQLFGSGGRGSLFRGGCSLCGGLSRCRCLNRLIAVVVIILFHKVGGNIVKIAVAVLLHLELGVLDIVHKSKSYGRKHISVGIDLDKRLRPQRSSVID